MGLRVRKQGKSGERVLEPLVLWEPRKRSGGRMGFACLPMPWRSAHSERRYLHLQLVAIDDTFEQITLRGDVLDASFQRADGDRPAWRGEWCAAVVDVESGASTLDPGRPHSASAVEIALRLAPLLQRPAVLRQLRAEWEEFRSLLESVDEVGAPGDWVERDWSWWEPGKAVSWLEVDPLDHDIYELDGAIYACNDRYCVTPGCGCGEVEVGFFRIGPARRGQEDVEALGLVKLTGGRLEHVEPAPAPAKKPLLARLWQLFQERHLISSRLGWRRQEMKRIGPEIARLAGVAEAAAAAAVKARGAAKASRRARVR